MKGVVRYCKKWKLSPRYMGPYEILQKIGKVAYDLKLPSELSSVHLVLHVSMLKNCISDPESIFLIEGLSVQENLSYKEIRVEIFDRQFKRLRNNEVPP